MNVMDIFVSYQFHEGGGGCIKSNIFPISQGNKMNFTHIIVDYMGKQHVESYISNTAPLLHKRTKRITPIFHENG